MIADFVSGWSEQINDGSAIWWIADALEKTVTVRRHTWTMPLVPFLRGSAADPQKRLWVVYSYGCAQLFHELSQVDAGDTRIDCLIVIVGVNRVPAPHAQKWEDCWQVPACVKSCIAFNTVYMGAVDGALPVLPQCAPIRNPSVSYRNANLFYQGLDHANIVEVPEVQEAILYAAATLAREEASA